MLPNDEHNLWISNMCICAWKFRWVPKPGLSGVMSEIIAPKIPFLQAIHRLKFCHTFAHTCADLCLWVCNKCQIPKFETLALAANPDLYVHHIQLQYVRFNSLLLKTNSRARFKQPFFEKAKFFLRCTDNRLQAVLSASDVFGKFQSDLFTYVHTRLGHIIQYGVRSQHAINFNDVNMMGKKTSQHIVQSKARQKCSGAST